MRRFVFSIPAILVFASVLHAQSFTSGKCNGDEGSSGSSWFFGHQERVCELRRTVLPARADLKVSARNGGIEVVGEDRHDIALEARVFGVASTKDEAESLVHQVKIDLGGTIQASGPNTFGMSRSNWYVNYRLAVPRQLATQLQTVNGSIDLRGLDGVTNAQTTNGAIRLRDLAGEVHAQTTNGGVRVALGGDRWQGAGLFAGTTNGGISVDMPGHYSAHLVAGTTNGGIRIAFPVTVEGITGKRVDTNLGSGGATVQFQTTNGSVSIDHSSDRQSE